MSFINILNLSQEKAEENLLSNFFPFYFDLHIHYWVCNSWRIKINITVNRITWSGICNSL